MISSLLLVLYAGIAQPSTSGPSIQSMPHLGSKPSPGMPVPGSKILWATYPVAEGSATHFVARNMIKLEGIVEKLKSATRASKKSLEEQMRSTVSAALDVQHLGQRAMVSHWENLGKSAKFKKMRDRYMRLFQQLIEENYMEQARKYIGGNYQITFTSDESAGEKPVVMARIKKTDVDVIVEFNMKKTSADWKIQDVKLDATSLEGTYRSSFNRIIKRKGGLDVGFPELLKTMEKRLAELRSGGAQSL